MLNIGKSVVILACACVMSLQSVVVQSVFAGAEIEWLNEDVRIVPDSACFKMLPDGPPGSNMKFGKKLREDDIILIGRVVSNEPVYLKAWYNKVTVQPIEAIYGKVSTETLEFLAMSTFAPTSKGRFSKVDSAHGPGWVIKDDIVLLALRIVKENSFINEYYSLYSARYLKEIPTDHEGTSYVQHGAVDFDWQSYKRAIKEDKNTDPYNYLTIQRARGAKLKDEIALLLGKKVSE